MGKYLGPDILHGFDSYKYNSKDTSPFSNYVMHPFWNWFVKLIPLTIAANMLTFVGFLLLPLSFLVLAYYDYDFTKNQAIPQWVWMMCAFNNFMSHTLDGVDGKQARRTKTSSVLGELFDHGLDAWSTTFFAIAIYDIFGQGNWGAPPLKFLMVLMAIQCTFVFTHWEKYNTGILYLPWAYDMALVGMTVAYLLTYIYGVEFWQFYVPVPGLEQQPTIADCLVIFLYISNYAVSVPICIINVIKSYIDKSGNMLSLYESVRPLFPAAVLFSFIFMWAAYSQTGIIDRCPRCFYTLSGVLFAHVTTRMIVSQMSNTRADTFNWMLVPLLFITPVCLIYNLGELEKYTLYTYTALSILAHVDYGQGVVKEIGDYINVYVFSVAKRPPKSHKAS